MKVSGINLNLIIKDI